jgi:hypothetical protein
MTNPSATKSNTAHRDEFVTNVREKWVKDAQRWVSEFPEETPLSFLMKMRQNFMDRLDNGTNLVDPEIVSLNAAICDLDIAIELQKKALNLQSDITTLREAIEEARRSVQENHFFLGEYLGPTRMKPTLATLDWVISLPQFAEKKPE